MFIWQGKCRSSSNSHHRSSLGEPCASINFLQLLLWQTQSSLTYKIEARPQQCQQQSFAVSRYSASFAGVQSYREERVGNEVNLIRQATRFRALVNRETLLGQAAGFAPQHRSSRDKRVSIGTSLGRFEQKWEWEKGEGILLDSTRTDLLGIDETVQLFSAMARLPFSTLVLRLKSRLWEDKMTRRRHEYPVFLRSDQSFRSVANGFEFLPHVALIVVFSHGPSILHQN